MGTTLLESVQRHVEEMVRDLKGDEDYLPIMALKDRQEQIICVGLLMPDEPDGKDFMADSMAAICTLYRATEAAFTSAAWMVTAHNEKLPDKPPSQCEDRVEVVFLTTTDYEGEAGFYTASLVRENDMVGVGLWEQSPAGPGSGGRFLDALRAGIAMGKRIPPEMAAYLDLEIAENREGRLIKMMTDTYHKARKGESE